MKALKSTTFQGKKGASVIVEFKRVIKKPKCLHKEKSIGKEDFGNISLRNEPGNLTRKVVRSMSNYLAV